MAKTPSRRVDVFDRETISAYTVLQARCLALPALRVVFGHITTCWRGGIRPRARGRPSPRRSRRSICCHRNRFLKRLPPPALFLPAAVKRERDRQARSPRRPPSALPRFPGPPQRARRAGEQGEPAAVPACSPLAHAAIDLYAPRPFESAGRLETGWSRFPVITAPIITACRVIRTCINLVSGVLVPPEL